MLTDTKKMLDKARDGGYAVGAFNAENAEMVFAIVAAAQKCKAPVILQTTPSTLRYLPPACFAGIAAAAAKNAAVPVALHLDHGDSLELVKECLDAGYTSVMFDGSRLPFAENADLTAQAVQMAKACGASCEGELGTVGGKEDSLTAETGADILPVNIVGENGGRVRMFRRTVVTFGSIMSEKDLGIEKNEIRQYRIASNKIMDKIREMREEYLKGRKITI